MTAVLPHAPPEKAAKPKGLEALMAKPAAAPVPALGKFQELLDKVLPKSLAASEKTKVPLRATEPAAEKAKEPKKADPKDPKTELNPLALAVVVTPPKAELPMKTAKPGEGEAQTALDKAKALRTDKKSGTGLDVTANPTVNLASRTAEGAPVRGERTEEKQKVFVVDRRTDAKDKEKDKLKVPGADGAAEQPVANPGDPKAGPRLETKADPVPVVFQTVAGKSSAPQDTKASNAPVSPRDALTFQQYMVEKGYGQMVDQARIVLKDQNAGEIRMTLHPESLGKVRVALNLSDNSLAGQIFVENQTVKEIFQSNMDNLLQAFRDGGWNDLSLQVSVGGQGQRDADRQPAPQAPQAKDYGRQVAQTVTEGPGPRIVYGNDRQINLTA